MELGKTIMICEGISPVNDIPPAGHSHPKLATAGYFVPR